MIEVDALSLIVMYVVPIIGMIVAVFTFYHSVKERHAKSAAEQAEIGIKLDNNTKTLEEVKVNVEELRKGYQENKSDITKLETKVTGLEGRVKRVENNLRDLEQRVHNFHTN